MQDELSLFLFFSSLAELTEREMDEHDFSQYGYRVECVRTNAQDNLRAAKRTVRFILLLGGHPASPAPPGPYASAPPSHRACG